MSTSTSRPVVRDIASPRAMAKTLALFYVAGGCAAGLAAGSGIDDAGRRWVVAGAACWP